jgi:hypothetical protein
MQEESALGMLDPEEESTELLRNVGSHLGVDTAEQYRRLEPLQERYENSQPHYVPVYGRFKFSSTNACASNYSHSHRL